MAATLPVQSEGNPQEATKRSSRRQWSVHAGGPKGLLRRLRSQLAEDGCPESQLVMGRTLLEQLGQEGDEEHTAEEKARLAVFWLTRASHQGSVEATDLLQHCLHNNIGICEHNYHEVRDCLAMELQEKLARRAGRLLFSSMSDGNEVVSSNTLIKKLEEVLAGDVQGSQDTKEEDSRSAAPQSSPAGTLEEQYGGERFAEEHIISACVLYHQGCVPPLHHLLSLPLTLQQTHTHTNALANIVRRPLALLSHVYNACLRFLAITFVQKGKKYAVTSSPFVLVFMFLLYTFGVHAAVFRHALPIVAFCGSFVVMCTASAAILLNGQRLGCMKIWSKVLSHFCPELDVARAECRFRSRCRQPYAILCAAVFVYVCATPLAPHALLVALLPAMCTFSLLLFFLAVDCVGLWHCISLALYLPALLPKMQGVLSVALQGVGVTGWWLAGDTVTIWRGINLHLGIGTALHLCWLALQVCVGVVKGPAHLPPHLASLVWSHLAVVAASKVTAGREVAYPAVVWFALSLVPAVASVTVFVIPLMLCVGAAKLSATLETLVLTFLLSTCLTVGIQRLWPRVVSAVLKVMLVCGVLLALLRPSVVFTPAASTTPLSPLQWDAYKNVCVSSHTLQAGNVHGCAPLLGTAVRWRGTVLQVSIAEVRNLPQTITSVLPQFLEVPVKCFLGGRVPECQSERCQVIRKAVTHDACSLHEWNQYKFDVKLGMHTSYWKFTSGDADVSLRADDAFRDFMLGLHAGDVVEFTATMVSGIGTSHLTLSLSSIKCVTCQLKGSSMHGSPATADSVKGDQDTLWEAAKFGFNFFMAPTLTL